MAELATELSGNPLTNGLTLSGGEPFCQAAECAALARIARERGLNVWAYTGYTYKRLLAGEVPDALALLEQVDVLVDGNLWRLSETSPCASAAPPTSGCWTSPPPWPPGGPSLGKAKQQKQVAGAGPLAPAGLFFLRSVLHPASVVTPGQLHNGI